MIFLLSQFKASGMVQLHFYYHKEKLERPTSTNLVFGYQLAHISMLSVQRKVHRFQQSL
jgi:hypothetical protein